MWIQLKDHDDDISFPVETMTLSLREPRAAKGQQRLRHPPIQSVVLARISLTPNLRISVGSTTKLDDDLDWQ